MYTRDGYTRSAKNAEALTQQGVNEGVRIKGSNIRNLGLVERAGRQAQAKVQGTFDSISDTIARAQAERDIAAQYMTAFRPPEDTGPAGPIGNGVYSDITAEVSDEETRAILATIQQNESGGDYSIRNFTWQEGDTSPPSTASGAYQFTRPTWRSLTERYGVGTEYTDAYMAPPEVQDQIAAMHVEEILDQNNNNLAAVPNVWYTGNPQGNMSQSAIDINRGHTSNAYMNNFMSTYNAMKNA